MRLLLDTHVALWMLNDPDRLHRDLQEALTDGRNTLLISDALLWEVAIKKGNKRLGAPDDLPDQLVRLGCTILPITTGDAWMVGRLPVIHKDPFDRLMIQQALSRDLLLATHDHDIWKYAPACGLKVWRT